MGKQPNQYDPVPFSRRGRRKLRALQWGVLLPPLSEEAFDISVASQEARVNSINSIPEQFCLILWTSENQVEQCTGLSEPRSRCSDQKDVGLYRKLPPLFFHFAARPVVNLFVKRGIQSHEANACPASRIRPYHSHFGLNESLGFR